MKQYRVIGRVLRVNAGATLALDAAQAAAREHVAKPSPSREGVYVLIGSTEFKHGEQLGIEDLGLVNKAWLQVIEDEDGKTGPDLGKPAAPRRAAKAAKGDKDPPATQPQGKRYPDGGADE